MKRIDINWNVRDYLSCQGKRIVGIVTIWEGEDAVDMDAKRAFKIKKDKTSTQLMPFGTGYLPELSEEENSIIRTMVSCFYSGLTRDDNCYHWMERE